MTRYEQVGEDAWLPEETPHPRKFNVVHKQSAAQELIAQAKASATRVQSLSAKAVAHLRELCDYNDGVHGSNGRVSKQAAADSLRAHFGWTGGAREALDHVCKAQLGRESFARKGSSK